MNNKQLISGVPFIVFMCLYSMQEREDNPQTAVLTSTEVDRRIAQVGEQAHEAMRQSVLAMDRLNQPFLVFRQHNLEDRIKTIYTLLPVVAQRYQLPIRQELLDKPITVYSPEEYQEVTRVVARYISDRFSSLINKPITMLTDHKQRVTKIVCNDKYIAIQSADLIKIWAIVNDSIVNGLTKSLYSLKGSFRRFLVVNPDNTFISDEADIDNNLIAVGGDVDNAFIDNEGNVVFDPLGTRDISNIDDYKGGRYCRSIAYSSTGNYVACSNLDDPISYGPDNTTLILRRNHSNNSTNYDGIAQLYDHPGPIMALTFSPDERYLCTGGQIFPDNSPCIEGLIRIWDIQSQTISDSIEYNQTIDSLVYSPDGRYIAIGETSINYLYYVDQADRYSHAVQKKRIWDVQNRVFIDQDRFNLKEATAIAYTSDGQYVITGSRDGIVRLWNCQGMCEYELMGLTPHQEITSVTCTPSGKFIIAGSADKTVGIWFFPKEIDRWLLEKASLAQLLLVAQLSERRSMVRLTEVERTFALEPETLKRVLLSIEDADMRTVLIRSLKIVDFID